MRQQAVLGGSIVISLFLSGCIPATLVGTAAVGTSLRSEGGVSGVFSDIDVLASIHQAFRDTDLALYDATTVVVKEGRVLLTGRMRNPAIRQTAETIARRVQGVQEIFNEIQIGPPLSGSRLSQDAWLRAQIESALLFKGSVYSMNYKVTILGGIVYVLGTSRTQFERETVLKRLREISGVKRVVSYIRLAVLPLQKAPPVHNSTVSANPSPSAQNIALSPVAVRRL
ncbi:MAG: BON domain-containing protein [Holosporales bacterium]|jgi:osmotically-inducible protein OsmY|nr:BON domain-containing protein [Holosporales bacterium]